MKLVEYLRENGIKQNFFAIKLGYTPEYANAVITGRKKAPKKFIKKVFEYTNGQVTEKDWDL